LPDTLYTRTFCLNVGEKFDPNYVIKFVKRWPGNWLFMHVGNGEKCYINISLHFLGTSH
jgi:hypothetical protein